MTKNILYFSIVTMLLITGCSHTVQTTSGSDYLEKYPSAVGAYETEFGSANGTDSEPDNGDVTFDELLRQSAAIEPTLTFPARIGLARIENGVLSAIPEQEIEAWTKSREKLGEAFGEFIPVSPLIANMASAAVMKKENYQMNNTINEIRLGAARQHLDVVLIYEVFGKSEKSINIFSIADITLIGGYLLPSKNIKAEGFANAILIDVLQGYPYGTAQTMVDKKEVATTWGSWDKSDRMREAIKISAAIKLTGEVEEMLVELKEQLAGKRSGIN